MTSLELRALICLLLLVDFSALIFIVYSVIIVSESSIRTEKVSVRSILSGMVSFLFSFIVLYACHSLVFRSLNVFDKIIKIFTLDASYRDITKLTFASFAMFVFALGIHFITAHILKGKLINTNKSSVMLFSCISAIILLAGFFEGNSTNSHLAITDVCTRCDRHGISFADYVCDFSDEDRFVSYVTISNTGLLSCRLESLYLSNNSDDLLSAALTDATIMPAGSYLCVFGSDSPFSINAAGGEEIFLSDKYQKNLDTFYVAPVKNTVFAKSEASAGPIFSVPGGFYDDDFMLEILSNDNSEIFYTLDGSIPTKESIRYTSPIHVINTKPDDNLLTVHPNVTDDYLENPVDLDPVDTAFIVRAVSVGNDGTPSDISTATYFVGKDNYRDACVVSLVADPDDLFGNNGIYVTGAAYDKWYHEQFEKSDGSSPIDKFGAPTPNYRRRDVGLERCANIELFDSALGSELLNQKVGIQIQGASTRGDLYKRFSIYARELYSKDKWFDAPIFGNLKTHSIVLRENFDNAFTQELVKDRRIAVQNSKKAHVFVNGHYFYSAFIQDKYTEEMISQNYQIDEKDVELLKVGDFERMSEKDLALYDSVITSFIENNDLSDPDIYAEFSDIIDMQSFIDFECVNIYLANEDIDDTKNYVMFRSLSPDSNDFSDGKYKWGLYDMDLLQNAVRFDKGYDTPAAVNSFEDDMPYAGKGFLYKPLFSSLIKNNEFRKQFVITFMDIVNTDFECENVNKTLQSLGSSDTFNTYDEGFYHDRASYITEYLKESLSLSGCLETLTLSCNIYEPGIIEVNTTQPTLVRKTGDNFEWSGRYFSDYPITICANQLGNHVFDHFEITADGNTYTETDSTVLIDFSKGSVSVNAIFK